MQPVNRPAVKTPRPIKILQYGEGNFLRAFVDHMVDIANQRDVFDGNVQIVKPIESGSLEAFREQDCVYPVLLRGKAGGEVIPETRVITCVGGAVDAYEEYEAYAALARLPELRFIVSNTTEAGIVYDGGDDIALTPPRTYPGKLTKFLFERYTAFGGAGDKGLIILPVELIDKNGAKLKECCLRLSERWGLPEAFQAWLVNHNTFCNTLVDRIVTGYPKDEIDALERKLGYSDKLLVTGEPFALWVIESEDPEAIVREFPLGEAGLPVLFTRDYTPYRERKVRLLNGAHTSSALAAYLSGLETVGEMMGDPALRAFLERAMYGELAPTVPLPEDEVKAFAASVTERFENPFIQHSLLSIALNSVSKFKARVLPAIRDTQARTGSLPPVLCFSLAALAAFYSGEGYEILDDAPVLAFFEEHKALPAERLTEKLLRREDFWGEDLTRIPGLCETVAGHLRSIRENGMRRAIENLI
jgi:tagaturonate reductase